MDIKRATILLGLAGTTYMMILAWNDDYGHKPQTTSEVAEDLTPAVNQGQQMAEDNADIPRLTPRTEEVAAPAYADQPGTSRLIKVSTDVLDLHIDRLGGDIVRGALIDYPAELSSPDAFVLIDPRNAYSARSGLIGKNGTDKARQRPLFETSRVNYAMGAMDSLQVDLTLPTKDGVTITKRFTFEPGSYLIKVEYLVDNQSERDWQAAIYTQIKRDGKTPTMQVNTGMGMQPFVGAATYKAGSPYTKLTFDDLEDESYEATVEGGGGYMAFVQHYFVTAWVPDDEDVYTYSGKHLKQQDMFLFSMVGRNWLVPAGLTASKSALFYIGPKDQYKLKALSEGLNLTVDYGFLWWLAQPLFWLLTNVHKFAGNWGIAIILLTVIVKVALYPLSAASFKSMAKLRKLQPEMARLKERHGDDRQKFSQETMALYKKEGANPLGGCLPMLLQMPVFLALYWTLMESVELRQAPFFLWIDDLSAMDPYFVLPILMGISMFLTQMLQPAPPDPTQAKIMKLMPVIFTVFFLWFPSGLVLYWLINNLLSILQQLYVTRQIEKAG